MIIKIIKQDQCKIAYVGGFMESVNLELSKGIKFIPENCYAMTDCKFRPSMVCFRLSTASEKPPMNQNS